ncbi:hypothetical protein H2O64_15335 [Kordia sp. YSTF-M3]|uniref:Fibronectin type-III domain-containing protein n=1 Tax=Kordia aestuariivivens TaxID=2759037 RepID=A0ABR7QBW3_9FLAO|nr:hypothetical protein [Kordia aestuariivivens]MBC8756050.1 hypothetical protein [Kordia aestuariivivens]
MANNNKLLGLMSLLFFISCDDILEENISNDLVTPITPTSESVITNNVINFSWNASDGVDDYRLQLLDNNQSNLIILDSLVSTTSFQHPLDPGNYKWRVRGENFAYETAYSFPISFSVIASSDLTNQSVILNTPTANLYTNSTNILCTWNELPFADSYSFELIKNLNGQTTEVQQTGITATSYSVNTSVFDVDAEYIWKVKAVNATTETTFTSRSLFLDREAPNQPSLVSPADDEIITTIDIDFNWTLGQDNGNVQSEIESILEISQDANFNSIIETITVNNGNSQQVSIENVGTYYWRVRAKDAAQNVSSNSISRSFITQ